MAARLSELIIRLSAEPDASLNETLKAAKERVKDLTGEITDLSSKAALGFGAFATGVGFLAKGWVDAAGQMEQYKAKLETVLKSSTGATESIQQAVAYAAKTPFDVKSIVDATTTLSVYGAKAKEVLPLVANLAAGMGKDIQSTALVIGKAWSGSLEGFESLRNEYGISTLKLRQHGAVVDAQGSIQAKSTQEIDKAREALEKVIKLNFGGAVERQMNTWQGATSNLSDAISRLRTQLGNELLPTITSIVKSMTSFVETFEKAPKDIKALAAWGTVAAGSVAALAVPVAGLITILPSLSAGLSLINNAAYSFMMTTYTGATAMQAYGATLAGIPPIFTLLTNSLRAATVAALAFAVTPLGAAIAVTTAVMAGLAIGTNIAMKESKKLEAQITAESNALQKASWEWHGYINALNEANKGTKNVVTDSMNIRNVLNSINASIKEMSLAKLADVFIGMGMGKRDINDQLNADKERRKSLSETLMLIQKIESYAPKTGNVNLKDAFMSFADVSYAPVSSEELKKLQDAFGGNIISAEKFTQRITELKLEFKDLLGSIFTLNAGGNALEKWEETVKSAKRAVKDIVVEIEIMQSTHAFKTAAEEVAYFNSKLSELQAEVARTGAPGILGLGDLSDTKTAEANLRQNKRILADLKRQKEESGQTEKGSLQPQIEAMTALVEAQEKGVEAGRKSNEKKLQDQKDYISKQKDLNQMNLTDEIKANERLLQNKHLEAEQRKEIETNIAKLKHDKEVEGRNNAERSLQKELDAVKLMTSGQVKEYDHIIAKIKEKRDAHQITEKQAYELNKTTSESRKTAAEKDEKDRYESMAKTQEAYLQVIDKNEEMSVETRLGYIESLGRFWEKMQREKVVTAEQAEDQLRKLIEKRAALEKAAIDANKAAEKDLIALRKQALDYDIGKLKEQLKGGGDAEAQLMKKMQERMDLELKSIDEKARKMEKEGVAPERRGEATAREKASLYEKQADELDQMIQQLMQEKFDETDRLGPMQRDSLVSSLRGRKDKYTGWAKTASAQAEDYMKQAEAKGLNTPQALTGFEVPVGIFSSSVEKFRDVITQLERVFNQGVQNGVSVPSSANLPMTPGRPGSQVNTNIYNLGGKGFTPTAEIEHKWGGLAQSIQKMQDNGYLGSIGGSLSY